MSTARWSIDRWHDLFRTLFRPEHVAFFPHKVFRWDAENIYQDCFFPFRCQHWLGGEAILGKSMKEVVVVQSKWTVGKESRVNNRDRSKPQGFP